MNSKPLPNPETPTKELEKLMQSTDPGTATLASWSFQEKMNNIWNVLDAKELANTKRSKSKAISTTVDIFGFIFAGASAFCWFWSAMLTDASGIATWNSRAALFAVGATLALTYLRGKSNMNAKAEDEVYQAITAAKLYQDQKQLALQEELAELKRRLNTLESCENSCINQKFNNEISASKSVATLFAAVGTTTLIYLNRKSKMNSKSEGKN
jgi:hypothetical protein